MASELPIDGVCSDRFAPVRAAFVRCMTDGIRPIGAMHAPKAPNLCASGPAKSFPG